MVLKAIAVMRGGLGRYSELRRVRRCVKLRRLNDFLDRNAGYFARAFRRELFYILFVFVQPVCMVFKELLVLQTFAENDIGHCQGQGAVGTGSRLQE